MNLSDMWTKLSETLGAFLPSLVGALAILVIGWLVASILAAIVRTACRKLNFDALFTKWTGKGQAIDLASLAGKTVFYVVIAFVLIAAFEALGFESITKPFNALLGQVFQFIPKLIGAAVLGLVAWVVASALRMVAKRGLTSFNLDAKVGGAAEIDSKDSLAATISETLYWIVILLFLPAILSTLGTTGILEPIQGMMDKFLGFLPNILSAGIILFVGWIVARIVQKVISSLAASAGVDALAEKIGAGNVFGDKKLSTLLGLVVYVFILIPAAISALEALALDSITGPASAMLETLLSSVPAIISAIVILAISWVLAKLVSGLITRVLAGIGFDLLPGRLGLKNAAEGAKQPSDIVGKLALVYVMLFAAIEAFNQLGFGMVSEMIMEFAVFGAQVLLAVVVLAIGMFFANLVAKLVRSTGISNADIIANLARIVVIVLAATMALRQTNIASDVVNLAFGIILGGGAIAFALAVGLGCREIAAREVDALITCVKGSESKDTSAK